MQEKRYQLHQPPIFVCGVQRAGTTLLVKMLNKSNSISFLPQETHLFPLLWNRTGSINRFETPEQLAAYLKVELPKVNYGWVTATPFLDAICNAIIADQYMPNDVNDLLNFILKIWETEKGSNVRVGEKTPAHIYYALKKQNAFPSCQIVLMCRDPRAAALSELIKLKNNTRVDRSFGIFTFIVRWASAVALSQKLSQREKVHFLTYEDLIIKPNQTLKSVTEFLNIDYHEGMLDVGVTNSSFQDSKQKGIQFNAQNLTRWENELPIEMIALIEFHLKVEMKQLGYKLIAKPEDINISKFELMKQQVKLLLAKKVALNSPALFHNLNRNKKYRN